MSDVIGVTFIKILDKEYKAKPSFKALVEMEDRMGCSVVKALQSFSSGDILVNHQVAILYSCVRAGEDDFKMSYEEFGELVYQHGITNLTVNIIGLLTNVLSGGQDKKKQGSIKKKKL